MTLLVACSGSTTPYAEGGNYATSTCTTRMRREVATSAGEVLWETDLTDTDPPQQGRTRDFSVLDDYGYRVNLTDFCGHTVLLVVDHLPEGLGDDDAEVELPLWLSQLDDWAEDRDPDAPRLTVLSAWSSANGATAPSLSELRDLRDMLDERGLSEVTYPRSDGSGGVAWVKTPVVLLQDPYRIEDAAAAAAAMSVVSTVPDDPDPDRRYYREREIRDRWDISQPPYYVVLHPILRIVAKGHSPVHDGIIDAVVEDAGVE